MRKVTFLGPWGATFTHEGYDALAKAFGAPSVIEESYIPAPANEDVLGLISKYGGYGALAMETLAGARIAESMESFIGMLAQYKSIKESPLHVIGAIEMHLNFCLMTRKGVRPNEITKIVAHPKSLDACKHNIDMFNVLTESVSSNGKAAKLVAENLLYATAAVLGPRSAAERYGLQILSDSFEDDEAVTTFFLIGPLIHKAVIGERNRALLIFKVPHEPGALAKILVSLAEENLNMVQIHSARSGKREYRFAIEIEVPEIQLNGMVRAMANVQVQTEEYLLFGPFQVLSR